MDKFSLYIYMRNLVIRAFYRKLFFTVFYWYPVQGCPRSTLW